MFIKKSVIRRGAAVKKNQVKAKQDLFLFRLLLFCAHCCYGDKGAGLNMQKSFAQRLFFDHRSCDCNKLTNIFLPTNMDEHKVAVNSLPYKELQTLAMSLNLPGKMKVTYTIVCPAQLFL